MYDERGLLTEATERGGSDAAPSVATRPLSELTSSELGARGEQAAARHLAAQGWQVIERNWRCPYGEVDIVAKDAEGVTVLVEVKTRRELDGEVAPEEAVDEQKRRRYRVLAASYLAEHPSVSLVRFDVVALAAREGGWARMRHLVNAFGAEE